MNINIWNTSTPIEKAALVLACPIWGTFYLLVLLFAAMVTGLEAAFDR